MPCEPRVRNDGSPWGLANERGLEAFEREEYEVAIAEFNEAIRLKPEDGAAYFNLAVLYNCQGEREKAIAQYSEAIRLRPMRVYNGIAWVLAVCADPKIRDGAKAVEYATTACELSGGKFPSFFGTLAAAYAEVGDFGNAVKWQTKYVEANLSGENLEGARERLGMYERKKPYRLERPSPFGG